MTDRTAAAFGVEARHPFFDRRLVEYCLSLPAEQKLSGGWGRSVMRRAMEGSVPAKVQWRMGKSDLAPGFVAGLHRLEGERLAQLREDRGCLEGYVDRRRLLDALHRFAAAPTVRDAGDVLWPALNLASWLPGLHGRYSEVFRRLRGAERVAAAAR